MRIGDLIHPLTLAPFPDPGEADPVAVRQTFVPTIETLEVMRRLLEGISRPAGTGRRAFFFVGRRGVGKTHFLQYLFPLLANPEDPAWDELETRLQTVRRPRSPLHSIVVTVPEDPAESLDGFLARRLGWTAGMAPGNTQIPDILALDGLSARIGRVQDPTGMAGEIRTCAQLAVSFAESGRDLVFVAEERHARARRGAPASPPLEALASRCTVLWLSPSSIAEVLTATLARKDEASRLPILNVLARYRAALPRFDADEETFVALYPLLPQAFDMLFAMREALPRFSPAGFAQWAIERALDRQPEELITVDQLFESVAPQLRRSPEHRAVVEACERLERDVMPGLRWDLRPHARPLARALGCTAVTGTRPLNVQQLANWLLVHDSSGTLPGYTFAARLLEQIEQLGSARVRCEGTGEQRTYALAVEAPRAAPEAVTSPSPAPVPVTAGGIEGRSPSTAPLPSPEPARRPTAGGDRSWVERISAAMAPPGDELPGRLSRLPDSVRTTRVWDRIRPLLGKFETVLPTWLRLQTGEIGPLEAGVAFERAFAGRDDDLRQWELQRSELISWLDWLPHYEECQQYLLESFPTGLASVDSGRERLLSAFERPDLLFAESARRDIEEEFLRFKTQYSGYYESVHDSTVGRKAGAVKTEAAVDAVGLKNLDMLSRLHYVDKKWFHRTRVLVMWLQRHLCTLPVRSILEKRPRCLCGFNPTGSRSLVDSIAELNGLIQEGTEQIRGFLRKEAGVIIQEAGRLGLDDAVAHQIASLLSRSPMAPLSAETIEKLDAILVKNPGQFHAARE